MQIWDFALRYWVEFLFGILGALIIAGYKRLYKRFQESKAEQDNIRGGIKALLRDRMIQAYNHYKDKGYCPIHGLENLHGMYTEYRALGGNGTITTLMEEIERLPRERPSPPPGHGKDAKKETERG